MAVTKSSYGLVLAHSPYLSFGQNFLAMLTWKSLGRRPEFLADCAYVSDFCVSCASAQFVPVGAVDPPRVVLGVVTDNC